MYFLRLSVYHSGCRTRNPTTLTRGSSICTWDPSRCHCAEWGTGRGLLLETLPVQALHLPCPSVLLTAAASCLCPLPRSVLLLAGVNRTGTSTRHGLHPCLGAVLCKSDSSLQGSFRSKAFRSLVAQVILFT